MDCDVSLDEYTSNSITNREKDTLISTEMGVAADRWDIVYLPCLGPPILRQKSQGGEDIQVALCHKPCGKRM